MLLLTDIDSTFKIFKAEKSLDLFISSTWLQNEDGSPCPDFEGDEDSFPVRAGERISHRHCIDYEQGQESPVLVSPVGSMMMRKTEFRTGARREHLEVVLSRRHFSVAKDVRLSITALSKSNNELKELKAF